MDKFGIFSILNSLLTKNSENTPSFTQEQPSSENTLNNLLSLLKPKAEQPQPKKEPPPSPPLPPLNSAMLATMNSHDKFIERVNKRNQLPNKN